MEEAVTRKFVHEESGSITSLCGIVFIYIFYKLLYLYVAQFLVKYFNYKEYC